MDAAVRACYSAGGDLGEFRTRFLTALRRVVPFDAAFMAAADPDTLLFTAAFADEPLASSGPRFLDNEFGAAADVNRFVDLARASDPVASLDDATSGMRAASTRYREIMQPLGMGDEARVALRVDGTAWGFLCLHRSGATGFTAAELATLARIAPHAGEAIRRTITEAGADPGAPFHAMVTVESGSVVAAGVAGESPLAELLPGSPLTPALAGVVRRLEAIEQADVDLPPASIRVPTPGGLLTVHAARLRDADGHGPIALTIAPAAPSERAALMLAAHGLTPAQRRVAQLVLQGRTTAQIVVELRISAHTVQDHLKSVFDKMGVRSRRELVAAMMR